jgi:flagellar motor switch protein FliN/FliY
VADSSPAENPVDAAAIDDLLKQAATLTPSPEVAAAAAVAAPVAVEAQAAAAPADQAASLDAGALPDQASIDELLRQATFEDPTLSGPPDSRGGSMPSPDELKLPNFSQVIQDAQVSSIDLLRDVELNVKIELGRSRMLVEDVLRLAEGSVVELDKLAGDPVDVFVNDRLVARGEVLVLNENFCVRVNEIVNASKEEGL